MLQSCMAENVPTSHQFNTHYLYATNCVILTPIIALLSIPHELKSHRLCQEIEI